MSNNQQMIQNVNFLTCEKEKEKNKKRRKFNISHMHTIIIFIVPILFDAFFLGEFLDIALVHSTLSLLRSLFGCRIHYQCPAFSLVSSLFSLSLIRENTRKIYYSTHVEQISHVNCFHRDSLSLAHLSSHFNTYFSLFPLCFFFCCSLPHKQYSSE